MDVEHIHLRMEIDMKEIGKVIKDMDMEECFILQIQIH